MTIAVLSDFHVVAPWTRLSDLVAIVSQTNDLAPDMIVLAGDFLADRSIPGRAATAVEIVQALSGLRAQEGVYAVLGNHDWMDCPLARKTGYQRSSMVEALDQSPIRLLRNEAISLAPQGHELWLAGFDSQRPLPTDWTRGLHDPDKTFAAVPPGAPCILLAHEPGYFSKGDSRAAIQISGHTHGGQLNLFGWRPMVRVHLEGTYTHGEYEQDGRKLIISSGIGFSGVPMRIGQPPELTLIDIQGMEDAT